MARTLSLSRMQMYSVTACRTIQSRPRHLPLALTNLLIEMLNPAHLFIDAAYCYTYAVAGIICGLLQADDALVSQLSHAIKKVAERVTNAPETVEFDYFSSTNFIGLFITEQFAALLKQITTDFAEEMKKTGEHM